MLSSFGSGPVEDAQLHRSIVYQFMQNPLESYWKAVKRILRYLSGTLGYGLHLRNLKILIWLDFVMQIGLPTLMIEDQNQSIVFILTQN